MKYSQLPPKMPIAQRRVYFILLAVFVLLVLYCASNGLFTRENLDKVAVTQMIALFFTSTVALAPELIRHIKNRSDAGQFEEFFGRAALEKEILIVFPHRTLKSHLGKDVWEHYYAVSKTAVPEGGISWSAAQDIRAGIYVSQMLSKFTSKEIVLRDDKDVDYDKIDHCCISVGLGFNGLTSRISKWCQNELFQIENRKVDQDDFKHDTDYFTIGKSKREPVQNTNQDYSIVARVLEPNMAREESPRNVFFVCAGRTAAGTAAAGYFLSTKWKDLYDLYKTHTKRLDHDNLVVVIRHTCPNPTCQGEAQEFDNSGKIVEEKGNLMIAWWSPEGD